MNRRALAAVVLWSVSSLAQNPSVVQSGPEFQSASKTVLVTIETSSPAPSNSDVLVSVNKQPFAPVLQLQAASTSPLDLVLVVDTSSSAARSTLLNPALNGVIKFVAAVRSSGIAVRTALVEFNAKARVVQNFTSDPIENSLRKLAPGGASAMYDALALAARLAQQSAPSTRRIILVVSDGEDNLSNTTREEAAKAAVQASSSIYAISLGEPPSQYAPFPDRGEKSLKELSSQTGGRVYFPKSSAQVGEALDAIQSEMRMQFFAVIAVPATKKGVYPLQFKTSESHGAIRGATAVVSE
jgi:VWFA-related protein